MIVKQKKLFAIVSVLFILIATVGCSAQRPSPQNGAQAPSPQQTLSPVAPTLTPEPPAAKPQSEPEPVKPVMAAVEPSPQPQPKPQTQLQPQIPPQAIAETPVESPRDTKLLATYVPQYATGFSVEYYDGGAKVVTDAGGQRILLVPNSVTMPVGVKYDALLKGDVERAVALTAPQVGHFARLGIVKYLKGVTRAADRWFIPEVRTAMEKGYITNVGTDNEALVALDPQIVFYGAGPADVERAKVLRDARLLTVQFDDSKEPHFMGRAEWVSFVAAFFDKEQLARGIMAANVERVATVTEMVKKSNKSPNVLWFYYSSSGVNWNVYTGNDYIYTLVEAAGGNLLQPAGLTAANTSTAVKVQDENFLDLVQQADIIIFGMSAANYPRAKDLTFFNTAAIQFEHSPAFTNRNCWIVGNDWFQNTSDVVSIIENLASIFHPELRIPTTNQRLARFFFN